MIARDWTLNCWFFTAKICWFYYAIYTLFLEAQQLPESYANFKTETQCEIDHKISFRQVLEEHSLENAKKIVELQQFDIWKFDDEKDVWIYKLKAGFGSMLISSDYTYAEYYFRDVIPDEDKIAFLEPLFRMAIQCRLIKEGFLMIHAACVAIDKESYAFSGVSGVGKSTRALKLVEDFSAEWISGDKPIVDPANSIIYGAPWDGKEHIFNNVNKKLKAILQVNRSKNVLLQSMSYREKYQFMINQIFVPMWDKDLVRKTFESFKTMITNIDIYALYCDQTSESLSEVYQLLQRLD